MSQDLIDKIIHFKELQAGWDSYSALPITDIAIKTAIKALKSFNNPYEVSPTTNGGILLRYDVETYEFWLDIYEDGDIVSITVRKKGDTEHLAPIPCYIDLDKLEDLQYIKERLKRLTPKFVLEDDGGIPLKICDGAYGRTHEAWIVENLPCSVCGQKSHKVLETDGSEGEYGGPNFCVICLDQIICHMKKESK